VERGCDAECERARRSDEHEQFGVVRRRSAWWCFDHDRGGFKGEDA
jgi:hypothetical protein